MKKDHDWFKVGASSGCLIGILVLTFNLTVGAWAVGEILTWFGKDIPTLFDVMIGAVTGEVAVQVAIVGYLLKICGLITPAAMVL